MQSAKDKNPTSELTCKLTRAQLQQRKATVIESLKNQVMTKSELENGFSFHFAGSDDVLDELTEFIKMERECCDFFDYDLSIGGDKSEIRLDITGPDGTKDFILTQMGL